MVVSQQIILYFELIPLFCIILSIVINSYIEERKSIKMENRRLKKISREQKDFIEKQLFLRRI